MKKIISIAIACLLLLETSGLRELTKIPLLFHHYFEHTALHPDDNLINFIAKHYNGQQRSDSEHDQKTDQHLPFKSSDCFQSHISAFIISEHNLIPVVFDIRSKQVTMYMTSAITQRSFDIWQPPKLV